MSRSTRRIGQFDDVKAILDQALASGGGDVELATHGKAVFWRQRAYRFRKMFAEQVNPHSPYDRLTMPKIDPESSIVRIRIIEEKVIFTPLEGGKAVLPDPAPPKEEDEIADTVANLAKDLGIDL